MEAEIAVWGCIGVLIGIIVGAVVQRLSTGDAYNRGYRDGLIMRVDPGRRKPSYWWG